ncbi:MAG: ABC transporter substrate-binding protein [Dehalococcoidales bacterium]|nr:ABC transporter substrate-binding protein [Dehalococcoidales bacterium]
MKKFLVIPAALILVCILVFSGCGGDETSTPATTTPTQTTPTTTEPTTPPAGTPVYGGTLRCVSGAIPNNLGYPPEKAPSDNYLMLPVLERVAEWDEDGNMIPVLAESWETDADALTITWHLIQGVKFTDGTDWNAEALRWNFQLGIDHNTLTDGQYVESLEVVGEYALTMHLNSFSWMMVENYGLIQVISPTAFESSGTTDEARTEWARANAVGTGPFTVAEWMRDDHIKFEKNPDYWQEGLPYLDAIEIRYIPDAMVAAATMEAGDADLWMAVSTVQNIIDLQDQGLKINWGPGMFVTLLPDSSNPDSPLAIKEVREAIEYGLNRPAIAEMLGQGLYEPLHQMASSTWPGYVEGYDPRPYNPEIAIGLLDQAGKSAGLTLKVMATSAGTDAVAAIQSYLGEVGITIEPDIADLGRYFGAVFGTGWTDLVFTASGINPSTTDLFIHYGPSPMTFRTGNIYKSPEYLALCAEALDPMYTNVLEALPKIKEAIRQAGEDAMIVPLWRTAEACIMQTYVHSEYPKIHGIMWSPEDDWMEAH